MFTIFSLLASRHGGGTMASAATVLTTGLSILSVNVALYVALTLL